MILAARKPLNTAHQCIHKILMQDHQAAIIALFLPDSAMITALSSIGVPAMTVTIASEHLIYAMSPDNAPVARVEDGSRIRFETCDCFTDQITHTNNTLDALDWARINPATGPVFIEGAKAGDTLAITIHAIEAAPEAVLATLPGAGVAGSRLAKSRVDIVAVENDHVVLFERVRLPLNPMIGVIGTAPEKDAISCGTPDAHGGNMDCKIIRAGTTLLLPVNVDGALLAMGDLHAAMGDGEVGVSGLEMRGVVDVEVRVIKGRPYPLPLAIDASHLHTIASHADLDQAADAATLMMSEFLERHGALDANQAIALQSIAGDLHICQVVDPQKTCRFSLPLAVLSQLGIAMPFAVE